VRLAVNPSKCTGCRSCMLVCSFAHHGVFDFRMSRIRIHGTCIRKDYTPEICRQCEEAPCIKVCPFGALSRSPDTGALVVDEERCRGCGQCQEACPHGGISLDPRSHIPLVCNLCGGNPECVRVCELPKALPVVSDSGAEQ